MSISVLLFSEFGQLHIKIFQKVRASVPLIFKIWISAEPVLIINDISRGKYKDF